MPYTADVDTTASKVQAGDTFRRITGSKAHELKIASVKVGMKWTEARDEEGALIFRKENDCQIWVMRETPTEEEQGAKEEEKKAELLRFRIEMLNRMHDRMHAGTHIAREAFAKQMESGHFVNASAMEELLMEQEFKVIACQIDAAVKMHPESTIVECMEAVANRIKEGLVNGHDDPTQSGGFTLNNAERQIKIAARRKFLQGINWGTL